MFETEDSQYIIGAKLELTPEQAATIAKLATEKNPQSVTLTDLGTSRLHRNLVLVSMWTTYSDRSGAEGEYLIGADGTVLTSEGPGALTQAEYDDERAERERKRTRSL